MMNLAIDEWGQPFLILKEQEQKARLKGVEAHKANILAARSVADSLKSSLGPRGMDKIIVSADGDITVTNDGATILDKMEVAHQCGKLLVELSKSQDDEVGDGTTGVVILAGALLDQCTRLIEKGLHPLKIADGYEKACNVALERLKAIAVEVDIFAENHKLLKEAAVTALGSKVVAGHKQELANIAVDAVIAVADLERRDVNFGLIKVEGKPGGRLEQTCLVHGIVIDKDLSHPQMAKVTRDAKIAILTCPFEPPKPKTKHQLNIKSANDYRELQVAEQKYFTDMIKSLKDAGANFVICQWGFDDEANHLLMQEGIPAVRWVGGAEIELIAIATGGRIVPRFQDLNAEKLGHAGVIREITTGTENDEMILIEEQRHTKSVAVIIRGGNKMVVEESKRSFHDAICCVRNLIRDSRVVGGGGSSEVAAAIAVEKAADAIGTVEQHAMQAFADSLLMIPECLASNSGLHSIATVTALKAQQLEEGNPNLGVDCLLEGTNDMMKQNVYESLASKTAQIALATQVVRMILKIDDVIIPADVKQQMQRM